MGYSSPGGIKRHVRPARSGNGLLHHYRGVAKVVLASGLTIAGAVFCLSFTRLPYFQPLGVPCAVGVLVAVAVALTLVPAVLVVGSRGSVCSTRSGRSRSVDGGG